MKSISWISMAALAGSCFADESAAHRESLAKLRADFAFLDAKSESTKPTSAVPSPLHDNDPNVVQMESFVVAEVIARQDLAKAIRDRERRAADEAFSWTHGGLLGKKQFGAKEVSVGIWPTLSTSEVGKVGDRAHFLRVDLLRLRW